MSNLDDQGRRILALLVQRLLKVSPGKPETYISYKDVHSALGLSQQGPTLGESLKHQGLVSLSDWTASTGKPAITGLIIDRTTLMPGEGYFRLFERSVDDFPWWKTQIELSKHFDWAPYLPNFVPPDPPRASDIEPPGREEVTTYRIIRDTTLARRVKLIHRYECQLCGLTIVLSDGTRYAEAHHIRPLGAPHNGPDIGENIICVCPNHHAELDFAARALRLEEIKKSPDHRVGVDYVRYPTMRSFGVLRRKSPQLTGPALRLSEVSRPLNRPGS